MQVPENAMRQILIGRVRSHRISASNYKQGHETRSYLLEFTQRDTVRHKSCMLPYAALRFENYCSVLPVLGRIERECSWCDAKLWREPTVTSLMLCNYLVMQLQPRTGSLNPRLCLSGALFSNLRKLANCFVVN
jgi:hypothetical protein